MLEHDIGSVKALIGRYSTESEYETLYRLMLRAGKKPQEVGLTTDNILQKMQEHDYPALRIMYAMNLEMKLISSMNIAFAETFWHKNKRLRRDSIPKGSIENKFIVPIAKAAGSAYGHFYDEKTNLPLLIGDDHFMFRLARYNEEERYVYMADFFSMTDACFLIDSSISAYVDPYKIKCEDAMAFAMAREWEMPRIEDFLDLSFEEFGIKLGTGRVWTRSVDWCYQIGDDVLLPVSYVIETNQPALEDNTQKHNLVMCIPVHLPNLSR